MKVVRTRPAPNFILSLKIKLCDFRDLCVSQFPPFLRQSSKPGGKGWSLRLRSAFHPEAKAGAFAYVRRSTRRQRLEPSLTLGVPPGGKGWSLRLR